MELEELLLNTLPTTYHWRKRMDALESQTYWEDFQLNDKKACDNCANLGKECEDKVVANFIVNNTVVITYQLEDYFKEYARFYKKAQGNVCDFVHINASYQQFVLNELTCTKEEYVDPYVNSKGQNDGKREKARQQFNHIISLLTDVKEITNYISLFHERIGLFSWKIPSAASNDAEKSMGMFMQPQQSVGNISVLSNLNNNFKFVQQIYPTAFVFL